MKILNTLTEIFKKKTRYGTHLEGQWLDVVVHDFAEAERHHEQHQQLSVHGAHCHPDVGAMNRPIHVLYVIYLYLNHVT